jgi:hypothetical protein
VVVVVSLPEAPGGGDGETVDAEVDTEDTRSRLSLELLVTYEAI